MTAGPSPGITAIILSWQRAANLGRIVANLRTFSHVREIIVWNNNPELRLVNPSLTVINSGKNYRAYVRYACAMLASHETIMFQDDDILPRVEGLERLYDGCRAAPNRIHGGVGRDVRNGQYQRGDVFGPCDIVLGQLMMFSRELLARVYGDMLRLSPMERGDDIAFSLLCGGKHLAYRIEWEDLGAASDEALWREPGHIEKRQEMVDRVLALRNGRGGGTATG